MDEWNPIAGFRYIEDELNKALDHLTAVTGTTLLTERLGYARDLAKSYREGIERKAKEDA